MHTVQPKRPDDNTLIIHVQQWKVARGHLHLPRSGGHKDARRQARGNARVTLRGSIER
jgi:hypothetical protein